MFAVHVSRNFGLGDKNVKYELRTLKHQRNEVVMTVGKHTVQVPCKNKRDGKQRAAQAILQVNFVLLLIECIWLPIVTFFLLQCHYFCWAGSSSTHFKLGVTITFIWFSLAENR